MEQIRETVLTNFKNKDQFSNETWVLIPYPNTDHVFLSYQTCTNERGTQEIVHLVFRYLDTGKMVYVNFASHLRSEFEEIEKAIAAHQSLDMADELTMLRANYPFSIRHKLLPGLLDIQFMRQLGHTEIADIMEKRRTDHLTAALMRVHSPYCDI